MSNTPMVALSSTEYRFGGQTGLYHGKVRDVYSIRDKYLAIVATDRISAFDRILPRPIPYKGQVLNQLSAYFLESTKDVAPNWLISAADENVSIGYKCKPFKVEMVVRGMLVGHAWREYRAGERKICDQSMPDGLKEYDLFETPIITPSTKAETGHDVDISPVEIIKTGLASKVQFEKMSEIALKLFAKGQKMAEEKGLILADTKYEFGLLNNKIVLIDEIHTPDSSRYFYLDSYNNRQNEPPKHLSKEFVREWLMKNGFSGQEDQEVPEMNDEIVNNISERYIELFQQLTGKDFIKPKEVDIVKRIEDNINKAIEELH